MILKSEADCTGCLMARICATVYANGIICWRESEEQADREFSDRLPELYPDYVKKGA